MTLGTHVFVLAADPVYPTLLTNIQAFVVGRALCVNGTRSASNTFAQYIAVNVPQPYCGTALAYTPADVYSIGAITLRDTDTSILPISASPATFGQVTIGAMVCASLQLDAGGDAYVSSRVLTIDDRTVARVEWCGIVTAWTVPAPTGGGLVHAERGSIVIGTRVFIIASGTVYSAVNPRPVVGQPACLLGSLDAQGQLIDYAASPGALPCIQGTIASYIPPTSTTSGSIRLSVQSTIPFTEYSYRFEIPTGTAMPANLQGCLKLALNAQGDAVVTGVAPLSSPLPTTLAATQFPAGYVPPATCAFVGGMLVNGPARFWMVRCESSSSFTFDGVVAQGWSKCADFNNHFKKGDVTMFLEDSPNLSQYTGLVIQLTDGGACTPHAPAMPGPP